MSLENESGKGDEGRRDAVNEDGAVLYEIPPKKFAMLPYDELAAGKFLEISNEEGLPLAELRPVLLGGEAGTEFGVATSKKTITACELVFGNGEKVLLDFTAEFSGRDFCRTTEQEESIINGDFLKERLSGISADFNLQLSGFGVKVTNMGKGNERCKFKSGHVTGVNPYEKGRSGHFWKNATGGEGVFEGAINGGGKVYAVTKGVVGGQSKYGWNEDSVGVGVENGRIVLGDGIGGLNHGECGSSYMVEAVLASGHKAILNALLESHYRFYIYNRHLLSQKISNCDTVLTGVQFEGDVYEAFNMGDTKWRQVRDGIIIARSKTQSFVGSLYERGKITLAEALTHDARNYVSVTAGSVPFIPDVWRGELKKGDIFWVFDDGMLLTDEEICKTSLLSEFTPAKGARHALAVTRARNNCGRYIVPDDKGGTVEVPAPMDNFGLAIYQH